MKFKVSAISKNGQKKTLELVADSENDVINGLRDRGYSEVIFIKGIEIISECSSDDSSGASCDVGGGGIDEKKNGQLNDMIRRGHSDLSIVESLAVPIGIVTKARRSIPDHEIREKVEVSWNAASLIILTPVVYSILGIFVVWYIHLLICVVVNSIFILWDKSLIERVNENKSPNVWIGLLLVPVYLLIRASSVRGGYAVLVMWLLSSFAAFIISFINAIINH